jgi:hypothetical protein
MEGWLMLLMYNIDFCSSIVVSVFVLKALRCNRIFLGFRSLARTEMPGNYLNFREKEIES